MGKQTAHDNGNWITSWLLWGLPEHMFPTRRWGGTEQEMETVHRYQKAVNELAKNVNANRKKKDDDE